MGTYVYTRRAAVQKMKIDGEIVDVGLASYAYKDTGWPEGRLRALMARLDSRARDMSVKYPVDYIVYGDSFDDIHRTGVYKITGFVKCFDVSNFQGEYVGYACKQGRNYIVRKDQKNG